MIDYTNKIMVEATFLYIINNYYHLRKMFFLMFFVTKTNRYTCKCKTINTYLEK